MYSYCGVSGASLREGKGPLPSPGIGEQSGSSTSSLPPSLATSPEKSLLEPSPSWAAGRPRSFARSPAGLITMGTLGQSVFYTGLTRITDAAAPGASARLPLKYRSPGSEPTPLPPPLRPSRRCPRPFAVSHGSSGSCCSCGSSWPSLALLAASMLLPARPALWARRRPPHLRACPIINK